MPLSQSNDFLEKLETEAQFQAKLNQTSLLPSQLGWLARWIALHTWQTIFLASGITAIILEYIL